MQPILVILRLLVALAAGAVAAAAFAATASAELKQGDILVVDPDPVPVSAAFLFKVDPQTGARTVLYNFGGTNPSAVAVEADGSILVTDTAAGTDPNGGTSEWGALYRLRPDPVTGELTPTVLSDFGDGTDTGRNPRAVAVEADGQILVTTGLPGTVDNRPLLVRVDPVTGARAVVSDFEGSSARREEPRGVAVEAGGAILVLDAQGGLNALGQLFRVDPQTGDRALLSDFGQGANRGIQPTSVAVEASGQILVTDEGHPITSPLGLLFRIDPQTGARTILSDFNTGENTGREPEGVALEADGQILVVDKHAGGFGMLFRIDPQTGARAILSDFGTGANQGGDPLALAVVPPTHGTIVVVNEVVNDNGGTAVVSEWTITVTGGNPMPASFPGAGLPGTTVTLEPGFYSVAPASGPTGYVNTFSAGCGGAIAAGETRTCTITHDDQPASLRVVNAVVNDNGGTAVASDWTTTVTGGNPAPASFPGAGAPGTTVTLDAGGYSVSTTGPGGYSSTLSADCTGTIGAGETKTCTITSDDRPGTLMVVVEVVNDHGGNAVPGDFFITVNGGNPSPASFAGQGIPGVTVTLDAGSYSVSVTGPPGYTSTFSPNCAATIGLAEAKTCTITSNDPPPAVPTCDGKVVTIVGAPGPTELLGTSGDDVIVDLDGDNIVRGRGGNDTVCTGLGNDRIFLGGGADTVLDAGGRNTVEGGAGSDSITTGAGDDHIDGGGGNDTVVAGDGANVVNGQAGNDTIRAGSGDDRIDGGLGFDTCLPGTGVNIVRRCEVIV